jgi:hypothetical protein
VCIDADVKAQARTALWSTGEQGVASAQGGLTRRVPGASGGHEGVMDQDL